MKTSAVEVWSGRLLLIVVMALTIIPFISLFVTALHAPGTYPAGLSWPDEPHWDNFALAFQSADMLKMLGSSTVSYTHLTLPTIA